MATPATTVRRSPAAPARMRRMGRAHVFWALFLLMCAANMLGVFAPLDRDEGAFLVIAQEVLHGRVPYIDVFDQKSPGIYYLLAGLLLVTKPLTITAQILALRLVTVLINALGGIGLYQIGKRWWRAEVGETAALLWLAGCAVPLFGANQFFTEPFASAAIIWAAVRLAGGVNIRSVLEAGLLLALGTLFKQTAIIALVPFALIILAPATYTDRIPSGKERLRSIGVLLAGVAVPWFVLCLVYAALGGLWPFLYQVAIVSVVGYPAASNGGKVFSVIELAVLFLYAGPLVLLASSAIHRVAKTGRPGMRGALPGTRTVALALMAGLQTAPLLAHPYPHYLILALPWLALLLAKGAVPAGKDDHHSPPSQDILWRLGRAASPVLVMLPLFTGIAVAVENTPDAAHALTTQVAIGSWIARETKPGSRLLIAPAEPEYYYLSGRLPVTAYVYLLPVDYATFPLAGVTDAIRARRFDAVVWWPDTVQSDSPQAFAEMLQALRQNYRVAPGSRWPVTLFLK